MRLVLLGPPGSGKGTQAALLARHLGVPAISTGDMLREAVAAGSELGRRVEGILARGELVDDATMADLVRERLAQGDAAHGFILDGYPRTAEQAATLEALLGEAGVDRVLLLEVPEPVLIERALGRQRADDSEEVVRERLAVYGNKTRPLVGYYESRGLLARVDGDRSIGEVSAALIRALEE